MFDLSRIGAVTVAVLGDAALDVYWYADMKKSELSRETPHFPLPIVREVTSPGAGGNVAANLAALRPRRVLLCGVLGDDWRGALLRQRLAATGVDTDGLIVEQGRFTQAYCKPMRMGISDVVYEDPRLDFAADAPIAPATETAVLAWLDRAEREADVLCVCDQFANGIVTEAVLARLGRMRIPVAVDSRARIERFRVRGVLKPNEFECRAALARLGLPLPGEEEAAARALADATDADVFLTAGSRGSVFAAPGGAALVMPAVPVAGPIDIVGAGDTSFAAFAACLAGGASPAEAAEIAALASAVTVQKIGTTGTATPEEILSLYESKGELRHG